MMQVADLIDPQIKALRLVPEQKQLLRDGYQLCFKRDRDLIQITASCWNQCKRAFADQLLRSAKLIENNNSAWRLCEPKTIQSKPYSFIAITEHMSWGDVNCYFSNPDILKKFDPIISHSSRQAVFKALLYFDPKEFVTSRNLVKAELNFEGRVFGASFEIEARQQKVFLKMEHAMQQSEFNVKLGVWIGEIELPLEALLELRCGDQLEFNLPKTLPVALKSQTNQWVSGELEFTETGMRMLVKKSSTQAKLF